MSETVASLTVRDQILLVQSLFFDPAGDIVGLVQDGWLINSHLLAGRASNEKKVKEIKTEMNLLVNWIESKEEEEDDDEKMETNHFLRGVVLEEIVSLSKMLE